MIDKKNNSKVVEKVKDSLEQLEEISKLKANQSPIKIHTNIFIENNQNDSINEVEENSDNENEYEYNSSLNDLK